MSVSLRFDLKDSLPPVIYFGDHKVYKVGNIVWGLCKTHNRCTTTIGKRRITELDSFGWRNATPCQRPLFALNSWSSTSSEDESDEEVSMIVEGQMIPRRMNHMWRRKRPTQSYRIWDQVVVWQTCLSKVSKEAPNHLRTWLSKLSVFLVSNGKHWHVLNPGLLSIKATRKPAVSKTWYFVK